MSECDFCGKNISFNLMKFKCRGCGKIYCYSCACSFPNLKYENLYESVGIKIPNFERCLSFAFKRVACPKCVNKFNKIDKKFIQAEQSCGSVKIFSENYQGHVPHSKNEIFIKTPYSSKNEALNNLKLIAKYLGYDTIKQVGFETDTDHDNNYYFTVFSYHGIACNKS